MEQLVIKDRRIKTLLEFGCGTTRFTRWWKEIGIEATGGDISPLMLSQALHLFDGDLVMADAHYMPFKNHTFDAVAFITTFEYYKDPVKVIREAARVAQYGIAMGMMNRNSPKVLRRRVQQLFGKNPFYIIATFYTPQKLTAIIHEALKGRDYSIEWTCTGLPKWFPVQQWVVPVGDFFGLYINLMMLAKTVMKEPGKIQHNAFEDIIFQQCGYSRKEVSTGPAFGTDVAIVDLPHVLSMALTSDPLSLIPSLGLRESAWLSVHLMANDMATTGCPPMYAQFVLNLPAHFSLPDLKIYWHYIHKFCKEINISITGGHTGFIEGQNSTIAGGGTLVTIAPKGQLLVSKNARSSNVILATKQCAISSSAILSMSFPETVKNKLGKQVYDEGCALFYQTSSLKDALLVAGSDIKHPEITAMHDVTEGGMLGAIYELAVASGNGAIVYNDRLPIGETQKQICSLFSIDPRLSIGAGSMIIAVKKGSENKVISRLKKQNIECTVVGELTKKGNGITIIENDEKKALPYLEKDPYWNAFFEAYKMGWK